jgi:hypothetical protein
VWGVWKGAAHKGWVLHAVLVTCVLLLQTTKVQKWLLLLLKRHLCS